MSRLCVTGAKALGLGLALAIFFMARVHPVAGEPGNSKIQNIRSGSHGTYDRLVFDVEGARPLRVGPPSGGSLVIEFPRSPSSPKADRLSPRLPPAFSGFTSQETDQTLTVTLTFRDPNSTVKTFYTDWRQGAYRLVLDISPSSGAPSPPPPQPPENLQSMLKKAEKDDTRRDAKGHQATSPEKPRKPLTPAEERIEELFTDANTLFQAAQGDLTQGGSEIMAAYQAAIKAGPNSPNVPLGLFRLGLCHVVAEELKKAEEVFKRVIAEYPTHGTVPLCWLNIAKIQQRRKAYIESIQAFRTALSYPLSKSDYTEANYALGKALTSAEAYKEAIDVMKKCLDEDSTFYRQKPDMLKSLGEAFFGTQQYDKSCESFLRYVNLQKDISDRDVVLAKIAESLLYMGETNLANTIYAFLEKHHPDSEGDVIGKIRKAEIIEQKDSSDKEGALAIYQDLSQKGLSAPLQKLVLFRLASWEYRHGNYEKTLSLIDEALQIKASGSTNDEFQNLRGKALVDWIKRVYADGDYSRVIQLYQDNKIFFQFLGSSEYDVMLADSYSKLQLHSAALEAYQQLLSKTGKKNDDWLFKAAQSAYTLMNFDQAANLISQVQSDTYRDDKASMLGRIQYSQRKYKEAAQTYAAYFQNEKNYEQCELDMLFTYIDSLMQLGRYADAVVSLDRASKRIETGDPQRRVEVYLLQSKCYLTLKQQSKAIEVMEQVLPLVAEEEEKGRLTYQLAMLYLENGKEDKALEKFNQLLQSSVPLWKAAAQQQLDYIQLKNYRPKSAL